MLDLLPLVGSPSPARPCSSLDKMSTDLRNRNELFLMRGMMVVSKRLTSNHRPRTPKFGLARKGNSRKMKMSYFRLSGFRTGRTF